MTHKPWLLEQALDDMTAHRRTLHECIECYAADDPELVELLRLATSLRDVRVPPVEQAEMQAIRARVRTGLLAEMEQDERTAVLADTTLTTSAPVSGPRPRSTPRWVRVACALAAVLLLSLSSGWLVTAAQGALPESPLYAAKRGEEWVALRTAWSYERQGEVLAGIAAHRLTEASAEADLHRDSEARALTAELSADMRQLIALTATMTATHENTSAVEAALARDLNAEYLAVQTARSAGLSSFAQQLGAATQSQLSAIQKHQLPVPLPEGSQSATPTAALSAGRNGDMTSPGQRNAHAGQGGGGNSGAPTGSGSAGGPGKGGGDGHDGGNGGGGGSNGHGGPNATPTATPPGHGNVRGNANPPCGGAHPRTQAQ